MVVRAFPILGLWLALATACSTSTTTQATAESQGGDAGATDPGVGGTGGGGANASGGTDSAASSGGGSQVELSCSSYCAAVQTNCATDSVKQYKSDTSCLNSCAAFLLGSIKDTSGNTLGCRAHYAALAATDPTTHCAAAGPAGGGRCGSNCDAYCALMARTCATVFEDDVQCRTECLSMVGVDELTYRFGGSGDNLQCRIYHVTFAAEGFPEIHCSHASPIAMAPCAG